MGAYIGVGSGTLSAARNSQEELRKRWEVDYVDGVFRRFMGESFVPYIETISEIFTPPRSTGVHFYFQTIGYKPSPLGGNVFSTRPSSRARA